MSTKLIFVLSWLTIKALAKITKIISDSNANIHSLSTEEKVITLPDKPTY